MTQPQQRLTSGDIQILQPTDVTPVEVDGTRLVFVEVERLAPDINEVVAEIFATGTAEPQDPSDAVSLALQPGTQRFTGSVPVAATKLTQPPEINNYVKVWPYRAGVVGDTALSNFAAMNAATVSVTVDAKNCLWFTWAPDNYSVPTYQESGDTFRPQSLIVPSDATGATVTVTSSGTWKHNGSDVSGPGGLMGNKQPMEKPELYKLASLKSDNIIGTEKLPLNMLVGLWDWGSDVESTIIPIGASKSINWAGQPRPEKLQLGFHDGYEWSNNEGEMTVEVFWS